MKFEETSNGNLALVLEEQDRELIAESLKSPFHREVDTGVLYDIIENEGWAANGRLYQIFPEDIGALTDAPLLTDEVQFTADGKVDVVGKVWWFEQYQVENFAETLLTKGRVVFQLGHSPALKAA